MEGHGHDPITCVYDGLCGDRGHGFSDGGRRFVKRIRRGRWGAGWNQRLGIFRERDATRRYTHDCRAWDLCQCYRQVHSRGIGKCTRECLRDDEYDRPARIGGAHSVTLGGASLSDG